MKFPTIRNRYAALCVALGIVVVALIVVLLIQSHHNKQSAAANNDINAQVSLAPSGITYPASWKEAGMISKTDQQAGVFTEANLNTDTTKVIMRKAPGNLSKNFDIQTLPDQVVTSLKSGVPGFKLINKSIVQLQSYDTAKIDYTRTNSSNQKTYRDEMFIVPTQHSTFYITYSADLPDLNSLQNDINAINTSAASYIKNHL